MVVGGNMSTRITSLSSFLIDRDKISEIEDSLGKLKRFSEKDYPFQVQDRVNSAIAMIGDCSDKSRLCYGLFCELQVLETYAEHRDKKKVRLIMDEHGSVKNLLQESRVELNGFSKELLHFDCYLKKIQDELISVDELVCEKCEGRGNLLKTRYVRERGSTPQPYTESFTCSSCDGSGKIFMDSEIKKQLSEFIQDSKVIQMKLRIYKKTLENYLSCYTVPSLQGYDDIEPIFPEEDPNRKKTQQSLSEFY